MAHFDYGYYRTLIGNPMLDIEVAETGGAYRFARWDDNLFTE